MIEIECNHIISIQKQTELCMPGPARKSSKIFESSGFFTLGGAGYAKFGLFLD
jgi:hypothetical protein